MACKPAPLHKRLGGKRKSAIARRSYLETKCRRKMSAFYCEAKRRSNPRRDAESISPSPAASFADNMRWSNHAQQGPGHSLLVAWHKRWISCAERRAVGPSFEGG